MERASLRCARRATSSFRRRGPSSTTSPPIPARRRTCSRSIGPSQRDMSARTGAADGRHQPATRRRPRRRISTRTRSNAWPRSATSGRRSRASDAGASSTLADPKDKLEVFTAVQRAGELMVNDDYAQAAQALERRIRAGSGHAAGAADARDVLHGARAARRKPRPSSTTCSRTIPQSVQALIGLANVLLEEGQDRRRGDALQADALARRPQHAGLRAPRRGLHRSAASRRRRCRISRRPSRSSPSSRRTD